MSTMEAPQHMTALAQANRVRLARAELKRAIADETETVADVIDRVPWEAASMTIFDLLISQHRWGRTRARRFLASIPMSESKTLEGMTDRQRTALVAKLSGEPVATQPDPWAFLTPDPPAPVTEACPHCSATGADVAGRESCRHCGGVL
jgi:hypothetical protein